MRETNLTPVEKDHLEASLESLGIQELEERLEVSSLGLGGGEVMGQDAFIEITIENCCNGGKCSGNSVPELEEILGHEDS